MKRKKYEKLLEPMQAELVDLARWISVTGQRLIVLFEGRDTAGKGGVIQAMSAKINPRQCRVVALGKPSESESGQWYFQRYIHHLPGKGQITLFDRSWYNRAGVEKVMGFAKSNEVKAFLQTVPQFEKMLVDDGIILFKYWLSCDQEKQEERFAERLADPLKRWKLSPVDQAARKHYANYTAARETMLQATHTKHAPWTLVDFNDQKRGRLTLIRDLLDRLPDTVCKESKIDWRPLGHEPLDEKFGALKPIKNFKEDEE
ncbi:MAG TPA: polyphosphate kinase 2 [Sphingomicrobium sp.]|nr:polyphosphate kinase 2 [Sphingomicrobium sp.]